MALLMRTTHVGGNEFNHAPGNIRSSTFNFHLSISILHYNTCQPWCSPLLDELLGLLELHGHDEDAMGAAFWAGGLSGHMVQDGPHSAQGVAFADAAERAAGAKLVATLQAQRLVHRLLIKRQ